MNELTSILRDKAAGISVPARGTVWHLAVAEWGIQDAYCEWLILQARLRLVRQRADLDAESAVINAQARQQKKPVAVDLYREEMDALARRIDTFEFDWFAPVMLASITQEKSFCYLLYLMLKDRHPDVTPEQANEIFLDNSEMVKDAVMESLRAGDPKHFGRLPKDGKPAENERTTGTGSAA